MPFGDKLSLLMNIFGATNSRLAKALSVDPSLISRWRTGSRIPAKDSGHLYAIASFFAEQAKKDYQKAALFETMGLPSQHPSCQDPESLGKLLYAWMCDESLPNLRLIDKFLDSFGMFKAQKFPTGTVCLQTVREELAGETVFWGKSGKQESVARFLAMVASQKNPSTLYLYSDENMEWFAGDRSFLAELICLLREVINRGNKIKIVHTISRDMAEMFAAIDFWLPLYMTGAIEPYHCPRYREHYFRRTMFVAPGTAALISSTLSGCESTAPNFLFTDPNLIEAYEREFSEFLKLCRPLMRILTSDRTHEAEALHREFCEQSQDCLVLSDSLSSVTMPEDLFVSLLSRLEADEGTKAKMLSDWRAKRDIFLKNLACCKHTEIVRLPSEGEIKAGELPVCMTENGKNAAVNCTPEEFSRHLGNIIQLMERFENFSLCISRKSFLPGTYLAVKDETGVIVAKKDDPAAIFAFNQQNMTNAFYCYLEEFISAIPESDRDRKKVMEKLAKLCRTLKGG